MDDPQEKIEKQKLRLTASQALLAGSLVAVAVACVLNRKRKNGENHEEHHEEYVRAIARHTIEPKVARLDDETVQEISGTTEVVGEKRKLIESVLNFFFGDGKQKRKK